MGTCSHSGCKKKDFKDGLCTTHMSKGASAAAPVYTLALARTHGNEPDSSFSALADSKTPNEPYRQRIELLLSSGPDSDAGELVHGVLCLHDTQKANNITVWYSWSGNTMTVWGLGSHSGGSGAGNDSYTMRWFDGTSKSWTRPKKKKK